MRVLVLSNYSLERVSAEVAAGNKPGHHLYGVDALRSLGWEVVLVDPGRGPAALRALGRALGRIRFPIPLGDLGQQWAAWRAAATGDLIYAPCQTQVQILASLRGFGLFQSPVVAVAHHPPVGGRLAWLRRWFFRRETRGTDRYPALSSGVAEAVRAGSGRGPGYAPVLAWGPDLGYYERFRTGADVGVAMATGRTGRDWAAFGRGATQAGTAARIFCLAGDVRPEFSGFGPNVRVDVHEREADLPYPRLLAALAGARVIAVPLAAGPALGGLTSIADALGLGKPLLVTRHPLLDLDIEAEGIGRWVAPGDAEGWGAGLRWFDAHPREAAEMGRRARGLAEARLNSRLFSDRIAGILQDAARGGRPAPP